MGQNERPERGRKRVEGEVGRKQEGVRRREKETRRRMKEREIALSYSSYSYITTFLEKKNWSVCDKYSKQRIFIFSNYNLCGYKTLVSCKTNV